MKIKVISPITSEAFKRETEEEVKKFASPDLEISTECIEYGAESIESAYDEALCTPGIIRLAEKAAIKGYHGIFISCMGDPALDACRERVDIPVVGPGRVTMVYAAELAHTFSVVTVLDNVIVLIEDLAKKLGLRDRMASVRTVDLPVLELTDKEKLFNSLVEESVAAIEKDRAHAIILGCTGMLGVADRLRDVMLGKGYEVPVLDPVPVAIKYLENLITLKLSQSKITYMHVAEKERNIWKKLEQ